jgi:hypothetical protein
MTDELLSAADMEIEAGHIGVVELSGNYYLVCRRRHHHLRTKFVLKDFEVVLEMIPPVPTEIIECETQFVRPRPDDRAALVLVSFRMAFLNIYTSFTRSIEE